MHYYTGYKGRYYSTNNRRPFEFRALHLPCYGDNDFSPPNSSRIASSYVVLFMVISSSLLDRRKMLPETADQVSFQQGTANPQPEVRPYH